MALRLTFYGGAGKVTGSNFLVEDTASGKRVLVDCGIEQGADFSVEDVYGPFPYDARSIDALVVTHAHLDHVGLIPKLVKDGFRNKIYMTPPTRDLADCILHDSVGILREEARRLGKSPLYEDEDLDTALALVETLDYHVEKEIAPGLSCYLRNAGHILGSATVRLRNGDGEGESIALSGDIGNSPSSLVPDWEPIDDADAVVMESAYGDRLHPPHTKRVDELRRVLKQAVKNGGVILMPVFALERTQLMLYEISRFVAAGDLPKLPTFLDSPLSINFTEMYKKWGPTYFKPEVGEELKHEGDIFDFPFLKMIRTHSESLAIEKVPNPKIIIAGAGMSHAGRITRWEEEYIGNPSTTLLIVGYQAPGSPGRRLAERAPTVMLEGREIPVRAEVDMLEGWSAHADRDGLLKFAQATLPRAKAIFTALGEPATERFLAQRIHDYIGANSVVPQKGQTWEITKESVQRV